MVKSDYGAKLIEANDKYRTVKAENEELKEKVDVLFKLGRSYINRKDNKPDEKEKETPPNSDDPETKPEAKNNTKPDGTKSSAAPAGVSPPPPPPATANTIQPERPQSQ